MVAALISPSARGPRAAARQAIGAARFLEVHVATPVAVCMARDPKGLYAQAHTQTGMGLTGVDAAYEVPAAPDLRLDTSTCTVSAAVLKLLALRRAVCTPT